MQSCPGGFGHNGRTFLWRANRREVLQGHVGQGTGTRSKVIGSPHGRGFILVQQFLFGQVPKLIFPCFRLSGFFPQLMGADTDLLVGWIRHACSSTISTARSGLGGDWERGRAGHAVRSMARTRNADECRRFPTTFVPAYACAYLMDTV